MPTGRRALASGGQRRGNGWRRAHPVAHRRPYWRALAAHLALQAGGVTRTVDAAERLRIGWLAEVPLCRNYPAGPADRRHAGHRPPLTNWSVCAPLAATAALRAADAPALLNWPRARSFLAFAAYGCDGEHPWPAGVWRDGGAGAESAPHSRRRQPQRWYENAPCPPPGRRRHPPQPAQARCLQLEQSPRIDGLPAETGAGAPAAGRARLLAGSAGGRRRLGTHLRAGLPV